METVKNNKPPIIPLDPPLEKGEMVNVLEKREKFDMFDQINFSQEKILPSFFPPFLKGG
ncbi:hypothetical protein KSU1_D0787 [Candidatus Jettenia caeni]|uniref:Uncharacterized protein n=1 Tax=Candidatus Jettenia caeni TaxID=247490 RepID=I3IQV1_9BACT|nr:hypothetical protein KSU1_D0787 [Candidatus Jettenia caeni]